MADIRVPRLILATATPLALLTACGGDGPEDGGAAGNDGREASGEILPSSISDDMIATDVLDSQAPLMQDEPSVAGSSADEGAEDGAAAGGGDAELEEPVPASPPSDEAVTSLPED